jgi:glutamate dehydrogenase (NAD(P)+)
VADQFLRLAWSDSESDAHGYLVIDRLVGGISGGGLRIRPGLTLDEVSRLAAAMSLKNGALGIAAGGAKCGLDADPRDPSTRDVLVRFVRAMAPIFDAYMSTGEDMGVQQSTLNAVFAEVGLQTSLRASLRASGDAAAALARTSGALSMTVEGTPLVDLVGGYGVAEACAAACRFLGRPTEGLRAVVQGFGSMGGSTARYLVEKGAVVVGVADSEGLIHNPAGLDVARLLAARDPLGLISRAAGVGPGDVLLPREDWLGLDCDLLVPAAVADAITVDNCSAVRAALVVEAANIPTTAGAEAALSGRGVVIVPDFVANACTNGWAWWVALGEVGPSAADAFAKIASVMRTSVGELLAAARRDGVTPRAAAEALSRAQLDRLAAQHGVLPPLVGASL